MKEARLIFKLTKQRQSMRLGDLRRYADSMEGLMRRESTELEARLEEQARALQGDEKEEFYDHASEIYQEVSRQFPNQFRMGLVSAAYTTLEDELLNLAKNLQRTQKSKITPADFKGDAYSRAKLYITKVAEIPLTQDVWQQLEPYLLVRNVIVHTAGKLDKKHHKYSSVKKHVETTDNISIDDNGRLILEPGYAESFIDRIQEFFVTLFSASTEWTTIRPIKN